jgi:hypothetical protein
VPSASSHAYHASDGSPKQRYKIHLGSGSVRVSACRHAESSPDSRDRDSGNLIWPDPGSDSDNDQAHDSVRTPWTKGENQELTRMREVRRICYRCHSCLVDQEASSRLSPASCDNRWNNSSIFVLTVAGCSVTGLAAGIRLTPKVSAKRWRILRWRQWRRVEMWR